MATLDGGIVNVAMPTISSQLHSDLSIIQWVVTVYLLTISSLLPVFGRIADLFGRKRIFSTGFLIFTLGSALCGLATNIWFLVGMRVFQAVGASMLMSNSAAIVAANFGPQERGRALGLTGTVVGLGNLAGPAIGGILIGLASWRLVFYINVPIGIIGYLAAQTILPSDGGHSGQESFDFSGALLFTAGMISLLFAVNNGQDWGWTSTPIIAGLIMGVVLLSSFFWVETKVNDPMIDLSLYKNRPFLIGNLSGLLCFVAMFANTMLMPFYLQSILNYNPTQVGLVLTAFPLITAIIAPISGSLSDKYGPVALTTGGLVTIGLGLFYLMTVTATSSVWKIIPGPLLMGLGSGLFQSPNNSSVISSVPRAKLGIAGGLNALVRNVGMVMGISFSVTLFENRQAAILHGISTPAPAQSIIAFMSSYHTVMLVAGVIAICAALISLNRKGYALPSVNQGNA